MQIRVVIDDDQSMVLGAQTVLLESEGDIEVVGQAHNGLEALKMVRQHQPDSLLTDIEMPEISSLELASKLKHVVGLSGAVYIGQKNSCHKVRPK